MDGVKTNESVMMKFLSASSMPLTIAQVSYDSNGKPQYVGIAMQGSATSSPAWRIEKLSWESDGAGGFRYISSRFSRSGVIWDNRASLTYD